MLIRFSWIALVLLALVILPALIFPNVYHETPEIAVQLAGQNIASLILAGGLLLYALSRFGAEPFRSRLLLLGVHMYLSYTYLIYSLGLEFNVLYLGHVALFALSTLCLFIGFRQVHVGRAVTALETGVHERTVAAFFGVTALLLVVLWGGGLFPAYTGLIQGDAPQITKVQLFVYTLDIGFIIGLKFYAAYLLLKRKVWGVLLGAPLMVISVITGFALLLMNFASMQAGIAVDGFLFGFFAVYTAFAAVIAWLMLWSIPGFAGETDR